MSSAYPIADMLVFPLEQGAGKLQLLSNREHLLRRFGQLTLLELDPASTLPSSVRSEADRFYFVISGAASFALVDLREHSPSRGQHAVFLLTADSPQGLLVPFGVARAISATLRARLIELSTHSEDHPNDRILASDELARYLAPQ